MSIHLSSVIIKYAILTKVSACERVARFAVRNHEAGRPCADSPSVESAAQTPPFLRQPVVCLELQRMPIRLSMSDGSPKLKRLLTLASFSAVRNAAASETQAFFSSRNSLSFFCSSVFQSAYLFFAEEDCSLCSFNSCSRLWT